MKNPCPIQSLALIAERAESSSLYKSVKPFPDRQSPNLSDAPICSDPIASLTGKPPIHERPLLTADQATEIVVLFQVLGNDCDLSHNVSYK